MPAAEHDAPTPLTADDPVVEVLLAWQALELASKRTREGFAARAGVTLTDFQALVFLSAKNGMPPKEMGVALGLTTGAMTALVDRLENAGYLTRQPHPTDRRSTRLLLTPAGLSAAHEAGRLYAEVVVEVVDPRRRSELTGLLRELGSALDARQPPASAEG